MIPLAWSGAFHDTRTRSAPAAMALMSDGIPGTENTYMCHAQIF